MRRISVRAAKKKLGDLIEIAEYEAVIITEHGQTLAGLISIEELTQVPRYRGLETDMRIMSKFNRTKNVMQWYGELRRIRHSFRYR